MFKFNNLKLRNRILWGYSIPVLLSIGVTILVYVNIQDLKKQLILLEAAQNIDQETKDIAFDINSMQKNTYGYIIAKNPTYLVSYKNAKEDWTQQTGALKSHIQDITQQQNLSEMLALAEQVDTFNIQLISLVDASKRDQAIELWKAGKGRELSEQLDNLIFELEEREQEILRNRQKVVTSSLGQLNTTVFLGNLLFSVLAIAIGLWIASVISKRVNQTVSQVASSSTEIAATVEQQERTVSQQAASVNQTTTTVDELGASSRQSAQQAEASSDGARQALTLAERGTLSVQQTMEGMSTLKEKVEAIAQQILRLSEQTNQIGSVSDLVGDLANQTNMLALNAAVEAARAGEHGKGFGVVAGEIRKLADQSKKSAQKINALVTDIQTAINKTVMVTDEGTKNVDEGINLAQGTAETFTGVADSINNVFLNSQQISLNAKQQALALQQVVDAMNAINLGAKESASGITQVKASTQQLKEAAQNLKAVV